MAGPLNTRWTRRRSMLAGTAVLLVFALSLAFTTVASSGLPWVPRTEVRAAFADVGALRAGDDVRIADVRVGYVKDVQLDHGVPVATLSLDDARPIYRDASAVTASVDSRSALGQKYVNLRPGNPGAGRMSPDEVIATSKTTSAQELSDVLAVLDAPTRQALGSTIRETGGGAAGHQQDLQDALHSLPQTLPDLGTVSKALSSNQGTDLTSALHAADQLSTSFAGRQQQIGELVNHLNVTMKAVNVDNGQALADTLNQAPDTLRRTRDALSSLQGPLANTQVAAAELQPGAQALGQATPDVRGVLRDSVNPLNKVPGVAGQAEPAVQDLTHVVADARPLAPRLTETFADAQTPLAVLAPYAADITRYFGNLRDVLKFGDAAGHWVRLVPLGGTASGSGAVPGLRDPLTGHDPYPAPGQAPSDRQTTVPAGGR